MSPENQWLEDVFPTEMGHFLGDMLVFGGVSTKTEATGMTAHPNKLIPSKHRTPEPPQEVRLDV